MTKLAFADDPSAPREHRPDTRAALLVVAFGGLTVTAVGLSDLVLLWIPTAFADPQWRFTTVGAHVIGMPLGTVGLAMVAAAALARGWRTAQVALSGVSALLVVALLAMAALYATAIPVALAVNPPEVLPIIRETIAKTLIQLLAYVAFFGWLGVLLRRATREG